MTEFNIDEYLLYLLARASHQSSTHFHARVKSRGVAVEQWRILASLVNNQGRTIGELAEMVLYQQPTLTKIVNRMELDGLVERHAHPNDGRKVLVHITDKGSQVANYLLTDAVQHENEVLRGYGEEEAQALKETLRTLIERTA